MFWDNLYKACENVGIKPNPMAKSIGISSASVTKWKNGAIPNGEILKKIADCLNVSVDYLLGREPEQKESTPNAIRDALVNRIESLSDHQSELLLAFLDGLQAESSPDVPNEK